jgi:hypothetical protein
MWEVADTLGKVVRKDKTIISVSGEFLRSEPILDIDEGRTCNVK